jgi:UDP-glucose 4-epimerase
VATVGTVNVLVTGGAGYIGSHTVLDLLAGGHGVVVVDDYANSSQEAVARTAEVAGTDFPFYELDLRDRDGLAAIFEANTIDSVIHFAGHKAVGESVRKPLEYYDNNIASTIALCEVMRTHDVRTLVFSSSATVYGDPGAREFIETMPMNPVSPYGWTKAMIEQILLDLVVTGDGWDITRLRYFNPIGAHPSGRMGEDPSGTPNNLLPFVSQVAIGQRPELVVFGDDYDTPDGTAVRDYIHVSDLAAGHVAALEHSAGPNTCEAFNLGGGRGSSVLEVIDSFRRASGREIPYRMAPRRAGDLPAYWADPSKAQKVLGWTATRTLDDACVDTWRWQSANPTGYRAG